MSTTVLLKDIVDALEMQFDESISFRDLDTGKVETVSRKLLGLAEESDDDEEPELPEWQEDEWEAAKRIASAGSFVRLPSEFDVHEWAILEDFTLSLEPGTARDDLLHAIHGSGAFRHFKAGVRRHRIEEAWFAFRAEALREIAIDWCEEHQIPWK
jgi:hypothetical protein